MRLPNGPTFLAPSRHFVDDDRPGVRDCGVRRSRNGRAALSPDQRVIQVLSRLTFGARPSDLERIKKIGANAFIEQQLDPDNIDDSPLFKRLAKLPTLSLPTPTLTAQYNPPKPTPTPVPPAKALVADTATVGKRNRPLRRSSRRLRHPRQNPPQHRKIRKW